MRGCTIHPMDTGQLTITALVTNLIEREGGYVDHPDDRGGPTNYGVTQRTLAAYRGEACTAEDVKALTLAEATGVYRELYWIKPKFNTLGLHPVLVEMVFDAGVHHGTHRATKMLQTAAGVKADGHIGAMTLDAIQETPFSVLGARFMATRVKYIGRLITRSPNQAVFAAGWSVRMAEFIEKLPKLGSL